MHTERVLEGTQALYSLPLRLRKHQGLASHKCSVLVLLTSVLSSSQVDSHASSFRRSRKLYFCIAPHLEENRGRKGGMDGLVRLRFLEYPKWNQEATTY